MTPWLLILLVFPPYTDVPFRFQIGEPYETYLECQLAVPALLDAVIPQPDVRIEAACMRQGGEPA